LVNRLEEFRKLVDFLQPKIAETLDPDAGLAGADIFRREVAPFYVRRNQVDVLTELPDLIEHDDWVEMTPEDLKRYRASLGSGNFAQIRQASLGSVPGESAKLDRLLEIEDVAAEEGLKVLVFSFFREALATVVSTARCKVFGPISGDVSPERRQAIVDDFTAHEGPAILAAQIRAGGLGLNIQAASVVVLIEPQWTPTMEDQAIKRAHRAGQTRRVQVHRLLVAGSVDERVLEINHPKRVIFDATARRSDLADASSASTDPTEFTEPNESQIQAMIEEERRRLGVDDGGVTTPNSG
jgi:SNF2 family DNA or RNA helicase